jgi:hypothetical protein
MAPSTRQSNPAHGLHTHTRPGGPRKGQATRNNRVNVVQTQTTTPSGKAWLSRRAAPSAQPLRAWRLEFVSGGTPFVWEGCAPSEHEAKNNALQDLAEDWCGFDRATARLHICIERGAS